MQKKVFRKLDFAVPQTLVEDIMEAEAFAIEFFLVKLKEVLKFKSVKKPKIKNSAYNFNSSVEGESFR